MPIDLIAKFSVTQKANSEDGKELFRKFLTRDEAVLLSYKHTRDRVIFTDKKIIAMDIQELLEKKSFRIFPDSKISSFSVETAGTFDPDSDLKI